MTNEDETPKLQVDSDWKAEAQAEKERLTLQEQKKRGQAPAGGDPARGTLPEASFRSLVSLLASQAIMGLGTVQDPQTKGIVVDLEGARFGIDLLAIVQEKTRGNLTEEESKELTQLLVELRARFVQISQLIARQAASGTLNSPAAP
jgi:Domain of unknown function (DUF1844)